jgi:hypothetical protein
MNICSPRLAAKRAVAAAIPDDPVISSVSVI